MKITRTNIVAEYKNFNQSELPATLKKSEFDFLKENIDLYGEDKTIDEYIDTFVSKLNSIAGSKRIPVSKKGTPKPRVAKTKKVAKPPVKKVVRTIKKKVAKSKIRKPKSIPKKPTPKNVPSVDIQKSVIKSFVLLVGKSKPKYSILNLFKKIEKFAMEQKIRKTSKYAKDIKYIADKLKEAYNNAKSPTITLAVSSPKLDSLKSIAYSEQTNPAISLIKRYVNLYGMNDVTEPVKRLSTAIKKAIDSKKIISSNSYYQKILKINSNLKDYLSKNTVLHPSEVELKGLAGIVGVSLRTRKRPVKKKAQKKNKGLSGIVNSTELENMRFETLPFFGQWERLIGRPTAVFHILFYGLPGSGKSTVAVRFAKYLAEAHNKKVLFLAKEEGISGTTKEKFQRLDAIHPNIFISDKMPTDLSSFDVLVIDSVNEMNFTPDDIRAIQSKYPKLSTVQIFKATKEGKFLGQSDFAHLVQAEFQCADGYVQAGKNRFGGNEKLKIEF